MRWLFSVISGILIGGVLHIVSLLAVPALAPQDVYSRLRTMADENAMVLLDENDRAKFLPFLDPAFVYAACSFDLSRGPLQIQLPLASRYVSMSFHSRDGTAFFSLNDRSALGTILNAEIRDVNDEAAKALPLAAGTIAVASPGPMGFILVRAFAPWASGVPAIKEALSKASCTPRS